MPDRRAIFLDRDGTLMDEVNYCNDPATVRAIPGAGKTLALLREQGWLTVIITNQSGLSKGYITPAQYEAVNAELLRQLGGGIDAIYFCADHPDQPTERRKPQPGMLLEAAVDLEINLASSWMIGDKPIDVECGHNAGCRTILVRTGYGSAQAQTNADFVMNDVTEALQHIIALGE
ncbi:MAG: D-glycero-alpha-D-manno-heptose-1,7-bisphosphate 7-phosphatase [Spartobacteria bacterium]